MTRQTAFPGLEVYMAPFLRHFHPFEGRERARCYVVGLMMQGERKSVDPMSERVNASERSMQRLLTEVKWDEQGVIQEYRRGMVAETNDPEGVFVAVDTAFPKKGKDSVCVARQYCGYTGKVDNCQIGVSLTYVQYCSLQHQCQRTHNRLFWSLALYSDVVIAHLPFDSAHIASASA